MNGSYLLDAIGLLDDDLIQEAERYSRPKAKINYGTWLGWAASFAVVLVLGYGVTHLAWAAEAAWLPQERPAASTPAAGAPSGEVSGGAAEVLPGESFDYNEADTPAAPDAAEPGSPSGPEGSSSFDLSDQMLTVKVCLPGYSRTWTFSHWYGEDRTVDTLPKGCQSLGVIEEWSEGTTAPYANNDEYLGCEVWFMRANFAESGHNEIYVELPEGGYLECR